MSMFPKPHDTIEMGGRFWTVTGAFLGGLHQESVYGLQVDGERQDASAYGKTIPEMFVPAVMLNKLVETGFAVIHAHSPHTVEVRHHKKRDGILRIEANGTARFLTFRETVAWYWRALTGRAA